MEMDMVTFTVIVDDIVYTDGHTAMACIGGGGPQTAFGANLWFLDGERVGLAAGIGDDLPESCRDWLKGMDIDTGGLIKWPFATFRAWQILQDDGTRTQVWRMPVTDGIWDMLRPEMRALFIFSRAWAHFTLAKVHDHEIVRPLDHFRRPDYGKLKLNFAWRKTRAKTYHAGVHPSGRDLGFVRALRNSGAEVISVEVYTAATQIVSRSELQALVTSGHIFSPNELEAISLVGPGSPLELIDRLAELGAEIVVLRRAHLGCIVHRSDTKETWDVPAFNTLFGDSRKKDNEDAKEMERASLRGVQVKGVVDPTGCGNTFCGGFIVGWYKTRNLLTAALWGSISASFMLEHEGVPPSPIAQWRTEAQLRLELLQPYAKQLILN